MLQILGIDHIVLRVSERTRALAFYCDLLGCELEREVADLGLLQLRAGNSLIDLVLIDGQLGQAGGAAPGKDGRNVDHFCLRVDPFEPAEITDRLRAA
ncbi:MAG: VOC family protein, partial [Kiloniellales bacterium]|nr:VOC family protein [Kiloniellales bacterium]